MRRLIGALVDSPHRFIVSKGPQHAELHARRQHVGRGARPQPAILPLVDAVISHAGNNTTTECLHFGKPIVALPLFWDQYDNAQRVPETGLGIRLSTYEFEDGELHAAIDTLVASRDLATRLAAISARTQASPGTTAAPASSNRPHACAHLSRGRRHALAPTFLVGRLVQRADVP